MYEFMASVLGSKWDPTAKTKDLLSVCWARRGVAVLECRICCRCFGLELGSPCYDLLPVAAKMYDLLPVSSARSGVRVLRCSICGSSGHWRDRAHLSMG